MADLKALLADLRRLNEAATPGPWQTRFIFRALEASRKDPDLLHGTPPERDWADADLICGLVNNVDTIIALLSREVERGEGATELEEWLRATADGLFTPDKHYGQMLCKAADALASARLEIGRLREALEECEAYFEERADAEYHPDRGAPIGNEEMKLLQIARAALAKDQL